MNCFIVRKLLILCLALGSTLTFSTASIASSTSLTATVLDRSGQPLEHAVVSLHTNLPTLADPSEVTIMDQRQMQFAPSVLAIQAGTNVSFPNKDNVRHHVYSFSHPNSFELKLYHGEAGKYQRFEHPGIVVLGCNIHDGMLGYLRVVDTPYFASSDVTGVLTIDSAPPGDYTMQVWHPDLGMQLIQKPLTLKPGSFSINLKLDITDKERVEPKAAHHLQSLFRYD